jgi:hypothetical protein
MNNIIKNLENMLDDTTEEFNLDNLLLDSDEVGGGFNPIKAIGKFKKTVIKGAKSIKRTAKKSMKKKATELAEKAENVVSEAVNTVAVKAQNVVSDTANTAVDNVQPTADKVVEKTEPTPSDTVVEKPETTTLSNDMMDKIKKARDLLNEIIDSNKTERKYIKIDNITTYKINYN